MPIGELFAGRLLKPYSLETAEDTAEEIVDVARNRHEHIHDAVSHSILHLLLAKFALIFSPYIDINIYIYVYTCMYVYLPVRRMPLWCRMPSLPLPSLTLL